VKFYEGMRVEYRENGSGPPMEAFVIGEAGTDQYGIRIPRQENQTEYKNRYVVANEKELRRLYKHGTE
jgi:hypothetical protein